MKNKLFLLPLFILSLFIISCDKDDDHDHHDDDHHHHGESGKVELKVDFVWGMNQAEFALNQELTHPRTGEKLTFETMKFYLSNIKLKSEDGTWFVHPESYAIIDASSESGSTMLIENVPVGEYTDIEYTIGVDAERNTSGAQTGALAPSNGMFWSWSTGYIMIKAEGIAEDHGMFTYHLGGFEGENNIVTAREAVFGENLQVVEGETSKVFFTANPARLWHTIDGVEEVGMVHMINSNSKQLGSDFIESVNFDSL